jgi:hypothetical protein
MQPMMNKSNKEIFRKRLSKHSVWSKPGFYLVVVLGLVLLAVLIYQIPAVHERFSWRVDSAVARIYYFFNRPGRDVFVPAEEAVAQMDVMKTQTAAAPPTATPTPTEEPTITPTLEFTPTPTVEPTATPTLKPLPKSVLLEGVKVEPQKANNCGPANLSMLLNFWGWKGDQTVTEQVLKPFIKDRNVMPYEMLDYVQKNTEVNGIVRYGGDLNLVKRLVAAGFPVLIERGYANSTEGWMGHYGLIVGYDDETQEVTIPDTYLGVIKMKYEEIDKYWAQFDKIYLVIFPNDRAQEVYDILGPQMDSAYNLQYAFEQVQANLFNQSDAELFFAWYSRGSLMVEMQDSWGAAQSFDEAFKVYATLPEKDRPWRMLWYQTGPVFAYYNMGRYHDVLILAKQTLTEAKEDALPESWVWKGRAEVMLGLRDDAIASFTRALYWHPGWWVAENELSALGVTPP